MYRYVVLIGIILLISWLFRFMIRRDISKRSKPVNHDYKNEKEG